MKTFKRFEKLIERLVEGSFERLFKLRLHPADLARALAEAMEAGQVTNGRNGRLAPNYYQVFLNYTDYQVIQEGSAMAEEVSAITQYLTNLMVEIGCESLGALQVVIAPQAGIKAGQISVTADHLALPQTQEVETGTLLHQTKQLRKGLPQTTAAQWQLVLPTGIVRLGMPVIRIGREKNNDVVIADRTVAKYHAQLRWRNGTYHLQNLNQSNPLTLNRYPVTTKMTLKSGDVLQLGKVNVTVQINLAE